MDPNVLSATKYNATRQASRHTPGKFIRHLMPGRQQHAPYANELLIPFVQDPSTMPAITEQHPNQRVSTPRKEHPPRNQLLHQPILAHQHLQPFFSTPEIHAIIREVVNRSPPSTCLTIPRSPRRSQSPSTQELIADFLHNSPTRPISPMTQSQPTTNSTTFCSRSPSPDIAPPIPIHSRTTYVLTQNPRSATCSTTTVVCPITTDPAEVPPPVPPPVHPTRLLLAQTTNLRKPWLQSIPPSIA